MAVATRVQTTVATVGFFFFADDAYCHPGDRSSTVCTHRYRRHFVIADHLTIVAWSCLEDKAQAERLAVWYSG